jgi:serine phosphatase RsbU (regulator of sigma subunit)
LGKTLELDQLLPKILDSLFQVFKQADRGFMILADGGTGRLLPKVIKTRRTQDETTARFSRSIVKQCLETGACLLSEDASADPRFALSQSIADFRIRSVMCAPLMASDGKAFGVIQVDTQDRGKRFHKEDLNLLAGVANQASIALENARLHADVVARERLQRDLELARQVQRSFLPERPPEVPGYEFFSYYESAQQVGGDFYDFLALPPRRLAVTLGDVAGKGVPAALLMAKVSADIRYCLLTEPDLGAAVTKLNKLVHQHTSQMDRFITLAAALLDYDTHTLTLVNAGHLAPLLYRRSSGTLAEATTPDVDGFPLGVIDDFDYSTCQVTLGPGDCLLAFTDGITEAVDGASTQFQVRGVQAALQGGDYPPQALGERIVKAVKFHATGRSQHDDIALVCFGRMR